MNSDNASIIKLIDNGKYDEALDIIKSKDEQDEFCRLYLIRINRLRGYFSDSIKMALSLISEAKIPQIYVEANIELAYNYSLQGDQHRANEYIESLKDSIQSLELSNEYDVLRIVATYYNLLYIIRRLWDNYELSEQRLFKSIEIRKKIGDMKNLAISYNNLAVEYKYRMKLDRSIFYFKESIKINEQLGNKSGLALSLSNLTDLYHHIDNDKSEIILEKLKILYKELPNNKLIELYYKYNKAVHLKKGNTFKSLYEAGLIFKTIADAPVIQIQHHIKVMYHLCEIYLFEMAVMNRDHKLDDLKIVINKLTLYAEDQKSITLQIESNLLLAIYHILKDQIEEVIRLKTVISEYIDQVNDPLKKSIFTSEYQIIFDWETNLFSPTISISKKLFYLDIKLLVQNFILPDTNSIVNNERSILLLIMNGISEFYSHEFITISKYLIEQFQSTIKKVVKEILPIKKQSIDRLKIDEYTILVKKFNGIVFSYIYTGSSAKALRRLDQLYFDLYPTIEDMLVNNDFTMNHIRKKHMKNSLGLIFRDQLK